MPPDFVAEETSGDVMVPEGGTVKLTCRARGHPEPHVQWRREDGSDIIIKEPSGHRTGGEALFRVTVTIAVSGIFLSRYFEE